MIQYRVRYRTVLYVRSGVDGTGPYMGPTAAAAQGL